MNNICDIIEILQLKMENERSKEQSRRISLFLCRQQVWIKDNIKNRQKIIKYWIIKQWTKNIKIMYILPWKPRETLFLGSPKSLKMVTATMKLKDSCSLEEKLRLTSVQFGSVAQSCLTLCDPMNRSTPGLPVHHQLLEFTQTHVHRVSDAIQPSHLLSSPSPPAPNPSQHQSFNQWVTSSHEVAKILEF